MTSQLANIHLILGGARSGKSRFAEQTILSQNNSDKRQVIYIATAENGDPEMSSRIAHHQRQRPNEWTLSEQPFFLAEAISALLDKNAILLIDCLTLWLSNWLCQKPEGWQAQKRALLDVLRKVSNSKLNVLLVSNEVGHGIVPMGELSREFVDESGRLHQDIAEIANRVDFIMAGLPLSLKKPEADA